MAGLDPATQPKCSSGTMAGYVYMMSNRRYGTIYIGVTADLPRRAWEHREEIIAGFTKRYKLHDLVWYEIHESIVAAIQREHTMKHWPRRWKTTLIDAMNPDWDDLYPALI
jgi:putative endonuclease